MKEKQGKGEVGKEMGGRKRRSYYLSTSSMQGVGGVVGREGSRQGG